MNCMNLLAVSSTLSDPSQNNLTSHQGRQAGRRQMGCCYAPLFITVYTLCMCPHLNLTIPGENRTQQRSDPPGATAAEEGWGRLGPRGGVCFSLSPSLATAGGAPGPRGCSKDCPCLYLPEGHRAPDKHQRCARPLGWIDPSAVFRFSRSSGPDAVGLGLE